VAEARPIRGSINLEPADSRRWSAIVVATDGSVALRIAAPPRRMLRRSRSPEVHWLIERGFTEAQECWERCPASVPRVTDLTEQDDDPSA